MLNDKSSNGFNLTFGLTALAIFILSRLVHFYFQGQAGFGYDLGLYLAQARQIIDHSGDFLTAIIADAGGLELTMANFKFLANLGVPINVIIYLFHFIINLAIILTLWISVRTEYGKRAGLIALALATVSLTQFEMYWQYLFRTELAILMMFAAFWLIKKKSWLAFIPILTMFFIHKSTPLIFLPVFLVILIVEKNKKWLWLFVGTAVISLLIIWQQKSWQIGLEAIFHVFKNDDRAIREGNFLDLLAYLKLAWWYLIPALIQFYRQLKNKNWNWPMILFGLSAILVFSHFIFYKRLIIYLDLSALILAGVFIDKFLERYCPKIKKIILFFSLLILAIPVITYAGRHWSLISREEFSSIKQIQNQTEPSAYIMTINSFYAPWLEGWSGRLVISPGFLRDQWQKSDWQIFWENKNLPKQKELLAQYRKPLYLFIGREDNFYPSSICFKKITEKLFKYECERNN